MILAVVIVVALAGIAIPAMAIDRAEVVNIGPPLGAACNSTSISVNKTIWDEGGTGLLVDTINATVGNTLTFNVTIGNPGNCSLTDIWVTDTLSNSLTYNDNATVNGSAVEPTLDPPNYTWNLTAAGVSMLQPNESINITFSANVTSCGVDVNTITANATNGEATAYGNDTATVNVLPEPGLNVTKQVRLGAGSLADDVIASINDTVTFNLTVLNTGICCNLTNILVTDILSTSLTYDNDATIIHPINGTKYQEPDIDGNEYTWNLSDFAPLEMSQNISISFSANVTSCGVDVNEVTANATCVDAETWVFRNDTATVNTPYPVGGEVLPIDKVSILAPWIALAALLMVGLTWLTLRRWRLKSRS